MGLRLLIVCCAFPLFGLISAEVVTSTEHLAKNSELIVIAKVDRVFQRANIRVATVQILSPIKGAPSSTKIEFLAAPTWKCDISEAKTGETVLLFLNRCRQDSPSMFKQELGRVVREAAGEGHTLFSIAAAGRGRIPLVERNGALTVSVRRYAPGYDWTLVTSHYLPSGIPVKTLSKTEGRISLIDLLDSVQKSISQPF